MGLQTHALSAYWFLVDNIAINVSYNVVAQFARYTVVVAQLLFSGYVFRFVDKYV
jgi:hypothetical protein